MTSGYYWNDWTIGFIVIASLILMTAFFLSVGLWSSQHKNRKYYKNRGMKKKYF